MARSSTSSFPTPSQPPSCRSTWIRTPLDVNLSSTRQSQDSRHSLSTGDDHNPGSEIQSRASSVLCQTGSSQLSPADKRKRSQKCPPSKLTSVKQKSKTRKHNKRTPAASNDESHLIKVDKVQDSGEENLKCRWCRNIFKKIPGTTCNLKVHRDGNHTRQPCSERSDAIASGCKLPITAKQLDSLNVTHHQDTLTEYLKKKPFELKVFNQLLVMWLTWAATEAHRLYMNLQAKVVTTLQDLSSKFTLIHDVWTTKGNRHAFMGISVAYITTDWKASCPPGLERQTPRVSKSTLGFIPGLSTIDEESKEVEPNDTYVIEDVELGNNPMEADGFNNDNNPTEQLIQNQTAQSNNSINRILKKVDFIIQRITSSSAKQFEYTTWSKNLEINGPSLIAGYGIQWNIKFQSREHGYKGRMVIAKLFELERERQKVEGGPNYYSNLDITSSHWEVVNHFNETLSEFYFLTKKMEGDYSSGSMILSEYHQVEDFLNTRLATAEEPELKVMLRKMLTKTDTYLQEALACDTILIATALNPCFRLSIYQAWFPDYYTYTKSLLQILFNTKKSEINATKEPAPAPPKKKSHNSKQTLNHKFDFFPDAVEEPAADELTTYLGGIYKLDSDYVSKSLDWWKLRTILRVTPPLHWLSGVSQQQPTLAVATKEV
ncbi:hypothetical protein MJO29_007755 [Puccinia striiformis f. sp. tritici]|nr:hypothetical protein MJO29_007755 [Puccinia striiformis f. sp. tritici]